MSIEPVTALISDDPLCTQARAWRARCLQWLHRHQPGARGALDEACARVERHRAAVPPQLARALLSDPARDSARAVYAALLDVLAGLIEAWAEVGRDPASLVLWMDTVDLAEAVHNRFLGARGGHCTAGRLE